MIKTLQTTSLCPGFYHINVAHELPSTLGVTRRRRGEVWISRQKKQCIFIGQKERKRKLGSESGREIIFFFLREWGQGSCCSLHSPGFESWLCFWKFESKFSNRVTRILESFWAVKLAYKKNRLKSKVSSFSKGNAQAMSRDISLTLATKRVLQLLKNVWCSKKQHFPLSRARSQNSAYWSTAEQNPENGWPQSELLCFHRATEMTFPGLPAKSACFLGQAVMLALTCLFVSRDIPHSWTDWGILWSNRLSASLFGCHLSTLLGLSMLYPCWAIVICNWLWSNCWGMTVDHSQWYQYEYSQVTWSIEYRYST